MRPVNGGGYGDPLQRDPEAVLADILDGLITTHLAEANYGVVLTPAGDTIDPDAMRHSRARMAAP